MARATSRISNPPIGPSTPIQADRIQAAILPTDAAAVAAETKWGVGRLPSLVSPETVLRWREGWKRYSDAITEGDVDAVERIAPKIAMAIAAMDAEATQAGHAPLAPTVWEAALADGTVLAVVRTQAEAHAVQGARNGRQMVVWTMDEIAAAVYRLALVNEIKREFPGATIRSAVKTNEGKRRDWVTNDPFFEVFHGEQLEMDEAAA